MTAPETSGEWIYKDLYTHNHRIKIRRIKIYEYTIMEIRINIPEAENISLEFFNNCSREYNIYGNKCNQKKRMKTIGQILTF